MAKIKNKIGVSRGDKVFYFVSGMIVFFLTALVLYPLIYVVSASFSSAQAVSSGRMWLWPVDTTLVGYNYILQYRSVWIGYRNTIFYSLAATLVGVVITMLCAFPLSRKHLRGRRFFTFIFTFTMIFSGGMIPSYLLMKNIRRGP